MQTRTGRVAEMAPGGGGNGGHVPERGQRHSAAADQLGRTGRLYLARRGRAAEYQAELSLHAALDNQSQLHPAKRTDMTNAYDEDGDRTPLHWAAEEGSCVELLLAAGADATDRRPRAHSHGDRPSSRARGARLSHHGMARMPLSQRPWATALFQPEPPAELGKRLGGKLFTAEPPCAAATDTDPLRSTIRHRAARRPPTRRWSTRAYPTESLHCALNQPDRLRTALPRAMNLK